MALTITRGHLTATDRRALAYMRDNGVDACATKRIRYSLTQDGDVFTLTATRNEADDWGRTVARTDRTTFTL